MKEFANFIRSKGVVGLAIGVIIGVAVNDAVSAFVDGVINPLIALLLPADKLEQATFMIGESVFEWGLLVSALINLIIIAAVVYYGVKGLGLERLDKKESS